EGTMTHDLLRPLLDSPRLPDLLRELRDAWEAEQHRRHAFWEGIDETTKAEFINGEALYHSPVSGRHWRASSNLLSYLLPYVRDGRLGRVGVEKVMIRCTRNDYEPNVCFWRAEVAEEFTDGQTVFPPPDFVVEILSKSTAARDRGIKLEDYAAHGVREYWIVDPALGTVEQYLARAGTFELNRKLREGELPAEAVPGFLVRVETLFQP
ncbi:MAG: Uma2 family endonuclease, partial [Catalinimonas sp.]